MCGGGREERGTEEGTEMRFDYSEAAWLLSRSKKQALEALGDIQSTAKSDYAAEKGIVVVESALPNVLLVDWYGIKLYFRAAHNVSNGIIEYGSWQEDVQGYRILSPRDRWELYKQLEKGGSSPEALFFEVLEKTFTGEYEKESLFYI